MPHSPLITDLRSALGGENVLSAPSEMVVYDCDALRIERHPPEAVDLSALDRAGGRGGARFAGSMTSPSFPAGRAPAWPADACRSAAAWC